VYPGWANWQEQEASSPLHTECKGGLRQIDQTTLMVVLCKSASPSELQPRQRAPHRRPATRAMLIPYVKQLAAKRLVRIIVASRRHVGYTTRLRP
jgi:hypothetical protein